MHTHICIYICISIHVYVSVYMHVHSVDALMPRGSQVVMATAGLFLELAKGAHCDTAKLPGAQLTISEEIC